MRQYWKKICLGVFVICVLVVAFWYGGNAPGLQGFSVKTTEATESDDASTKRTSDVGDNADDIDTTIEEEPQNIFQQIIMNIKLKKKASTSSHKTQNSKVAQNNANKAVDKQEKENKKSKSKKKSKQKKASEKEEATTKENQTSNSSNNEQENTTGSTTESSYIESTTEQTTTQSTEEQEIRKDTVYISISCETLLDHMDSLKESKKKYVPKDGIILDEVAVEIEEGDTVFDVLQRATKEHKIHLEFNYTPSLKSHYIEGIHNIYEFDAGNLSGWMYCVNDEFTGVGCSSWEVEDGDVIRWLYTCDLGKDVGDSFE